MLKIIEIHPSATAGGEYIVLQNQGLRTLSLHGWSVCTEAYLTGDACAAARSMYIFTDHVVIRPYGRVVLFTGPGETGWYPTTDDQLAYVVHWDRPEPAWAHADRLLLLHVTTSRKVVPPSRTRARPPGETSG